MNRFLNLSNTLGKAFLYRNKLRFLSTESKTVNSINDSNIVVKTENFDNIAVVSFDTLNSKVNILSAFVDKLEKELLAAVNKPDVAGVVLMSSKLDCFCVGADINMLSKLNSAEEVTQLSRTAQILLQKLEDSKKPIVVAISGSCLGGGLELALACHYRVALNHPKTALGFPEVMLGLLPGAGGTQRALKKMNVLSALTATTTGKNYSANSAKREGLVDLSLNVVGSGIASKEENNLRYLKDIAVMVARDPTFIGPKKQPILVTRFTEYAIRNIGLVRDFILKKAKQQAEKLTNGNYPAPLKIIEVIGNTLKSGHNIGYRLESENFGYLSQTRQSKALVSLFRGRTECSKNKTNVKPVKEVKKVGVLGAGLMGAGIAEVSLLKAKLNVVVNDVTSKGLIRGQDQMYASLSDAIKKKKMTSFDAERNMASITWTVDNKYLADCDMIIEAIVEDLKVKHMVIKEIEKIIPKDTVIATNTSALSIDAIADASSRPQNIVGMHYFSPVPKMQLLEIVQGKRTSIQSISTAVDVGLKQGKLCIVVKDSPGFYTTRILVAALSEILLLLKEGVSPNDLDKETKRFGFPIGCVTLIDEVGLDVGLHICKYLSSVYGDRLCGQEYDILDKLVSTKNLGRKSGSGFKVYNTKKSGERPINPVFTEHIKNSPSKKTSFSSDAKDIQMRIGSRMVNEAVLCLEENVLASPVDGDVGAVFGLGFPPFIGGPFKFVDEYGSANLVSTMCKFQDGLKTNRFKPCQLLIDYSKDPSKKFRG